MRDRRAGILLASFPLAYYMVLGSGYTVFARYMIPVVPFLCLAAGYAVTEGARWMAARAGHPARARALAWVLAVVVMAPSAWSVVRFDQLLSLTDNRLVAASWVEARFPNGASLAHVGPEGGRIVPFAGEPARASRFPASLYDPASAADIVVVQTSALFPADDRSAVVRALADRYVLAADFPAERAHPANVYDWQDEFYLPLTAFRGITRPGPNIAIYVRR